MKQAKKDLIALSMAQLDIALKPFTMRSDGKRQLRMAYKRLLKQALADYELPDSRRKYEFSSWRTRQKRILNLRGDESTW